MKDSNNHPHCETDLRTSGKPTGGVSSACTPPPLPPLPPSSGAVEEGGIGDLLLDNKPTFKEGHTRYVTLRVENITEVARYAQRFSVGGRHREHHAEAARTEPEDTSERRHEKIKFYILSRGFFIMGN